MNGTLTFNVKSTFNMNFNIVFQMITATSNWGFWRIICNRIYDFLREPNPKFVGFDNFEFNY